jgi:hypothetical protein
MYTRTPPRSLGDAIAALTDGTSLPVTKAGVDTSDPLPVVLDALRTHIALTIDRQKREDVQRRNAISWSIANAPTIDDTAVVAGLVYDFTYAEALPVIEAVFPGMDIDMPRHLYGYTFGPDRDAAYAQPLPDVLTAEFLLHCALVLKSGWEVNDHGWAWWTSGDHVTLLIAAEWVARWDLDSLTACARARFTEDELLTFLLHEELPDPDTVTMMAAFFPRV